MKDRFVVFGLIPFRKSGTIKDMKQKAYGFTIVELLIAIVVIGILAAISIVAYNSVTQRARWADISSSMAK